VATSSRLLQIIGLFFRISSLLLGSFAKEMYNFKEPTNCSHPIQVTKHTFESTCVCFCVSVLFVCVCVCHREWITTLRED